MTYIYQMYQIWTFEQRRMVPCFCSAAAAFEEKVWLSHHACKLAFARCLKAE